MGNHVQEASTTPINTTSARNLDELQSPLARDTGKLFFRACVNSVYWVCAGQGKKNKDQELTLQSNESKVNN